MICKFTNAEMMQEQFVYNITEDILVHMETNNISRIELARLAGMNKSQVTLFFEGHNIGLKTICRIICALNLEISLRVIQDDKD